MPHFITDCSASIFKLQLEGSIIETIHAAAKSTGLFSEHDIKVRIRPFGNYSTGNNVVDFIHVFAYIMEGRTDEQKMNVSKSIVKALVSIFPNVPNIGANIIEFENSNYFNRNKL